VANAARKYEILHERDDDDTERTDKRQKSGDQNQPTSQQSSHRNHGHHNDRHGSDRRGECRRAAGTCFKCGQAGHLQKDCKKNTTASTYGQADKKPGASGRVLAITEGHAANTSGTITGTLFIYGHAVFVLFDTGATHSVISFAFASRVTTTPMLLDYVLCISTTMQDSVRITHVYRNLPLQFDDKIRAINALPLDMCEFDIILGLDWLTEHHAMIDCRSYRVIFGDIHAPILPLVWIVDYQQINALYKDFVPQKELSAEQKYFPSSSIPSANNSKETASISASMMNNSLHAEIKQIKRKSIEIQEGLQMERREDESLYFMDRMWVPLVGDVRMVILNEAHKSRYPVHLGTDKMYHNLRDMYRWPGIKRDIAIYVSKCLTCAKVKAEHQRPSGLLQQLEIPKWKSDKFNMDLITKLPRLRSGHDTIWVIVDRLTKSAYFLAICEDFSTKRDWESSLTGLELVQEMTYKVVLVKEKPKVARDRQKSYVDYGRKPLELEEGDHVLLKRCLADANLHVPLDEIKVDKTLLFFEEPVEIMDQEIKKLKRRKKALVKVRWNSKRSPKFTWEHEDQMRIKYPQLFVDQVVKPAS
nr:putative reverse transcriptase domain-containing protein [Tanacetum cinerariifolium]